MQGQAALQIPLRTRDLVAIQTTGDADFDPLATKAQRRVHCLAHGAAEAHALFQLQRDRFAHQLRVQLRLVHFLDIDKDIAVGALLQFHLELVDLGALAANDDARPRRLDDDAQLVARPLDPEGADARRLELFLELLLELEIFQQQLGVIALHEPARFPRLGVAQPESVRMNFLTHCYLLAPFLARAFAFAGVAGCSSTLVTKSCLASAPRSAKAISMCAMRR